MSRLRAIARESRAGAAAVDTRLANRNPNLVPARARRPRRETIDDFSRMAIEASAVVRRIRHRDDIPDAVMAILRSENRPARLAMAPHAMLEALGWNRALVEIRSGRAEAHDEVGLSVAFAGIAETGTLMMASGPSSPATLGFLPECHIVVLDADDVRGAYEDGWALLRARGDLPRTVNFITGPSRSADIEQKLQMGAHGPRNLHILMIDPDAAEPAGDR
ncbi:MAG: lactate utilization protein C [Alphaproteobacteria bacterium]